MSRLSLDCLFPSLKVSVSVESLDLFNKLFFFNSLNLFIYSGLEHQNVTLALK